ncbi:MAG: hypothetical protein SNJ74_12585 [Fimbriimonadaceae bacterium]
MRFAMIFVLLTLLAGFAVGQASNRAAIEAEKRMLVQLEEEYRKAKTEHTRAPRDAAKRKAYVDATMKLGMETMTALSMPPREKYPKALRLFREVLRVDPKNKEAAKWRDQIVDIYRSMGRPVPT